MKFTHLRNAISSLALTAILLYHTTKTPSPKIVFVPFLLCGCAMTLQSIAQLFGAKKLTSMFRSLFAAGFFLFWFGFLTFAAVLCIRDKTYTLLIFTLPFWLVGVQCVKRFLPSVTAKQNSRSSKEKADPFYLPLIVTALLVMALMAAGTVLLILGIQTRSMVSVFAGAFFLFGSFTFVLAALATTGCLDRFKGDLLGIYMGSFLTLAGVGSLFLKYSETNSWSKTLSAFGPWVLVPMLMIGFGVFSVIKFWNTKR